MSIGILSVMINRLAAIVNVEAGIDEAEGDEKNPHTTPKKAIAKK